MAFRLRSVAGGLAALAALGITQAAHAQTTITAGQSGVSVPTVGFFGGTQLGTTLSSPYTITLPTNNQGATITATLLSAAYSGGTGATGVDIYYQIQFVRSTPSGPPISFNLTNFSVSGFGASTTLAVGQTTTDIDGATAQFQTGTIQATSADRSASGTNLFFNFNNANISLSSAQSTVYTYTAVVRSNANNAVATGTSTLSANSTTGPATNVYVAANSPEPGTFSLLGLGLASGFTGIVARRRRLTKKTA